MEHEVKGRNYTLVGISLGIVFPVIAIAADLIYGDLSFSANNLVSLYTRGPLHWIILSAPLVLGSVFYFFEKAVSRQEADLREDKKKNEKQFQQLESFIADIERGDLSDKNYQFEDEHLTGLLTSLKGKLAAQKAQDERERWIAEGHAKFGEIFRLNNDPVSLSEEVIKNVVKYVGLNQGSIFFHEITEDNDDILSLKACYAYDRKKYISKTIKSGEGLVGQCYLEGETIMLKDVPNNYVRITSGLGEATPRFLVLIPIKANDRTEGILELAGFKALESYQIKFLEKVSEGFASVIRSVKTASETKKLLDETRDQTEQLQAQEEEIRQNVEEMQATQEQLTRQLEESKILRERVERRERVMGLTTILSETDLHGTITYVNDKFCEVAKYHRDELLGRPHNIVRHPDMPKELYKLLWQNIQQGNIFNGIIKNKAKDGTHYWVDATIVPMKNEKGEITKFVGARYHIKDDGLATALYNRQADRYKWPRL